MVTRVDTRSLRTGAVVRSSSDVHHRARMGSRRLATVLVVAIVLWSMLFGLPVQPAEAAGGAFGGGDGSVGTPYVIEDVWDLQNMSSNLSAHYVLKNDIDASATVSWNSGAGFVPVGTFSNWFTGSLDGKNHTITGLFIKYSSGNIGL